MSAVGGVLRHASHTLGRAAQATTEAAGALGGAAVNGVIGGVVGTAAGMRRGADTGSRSSAAAALTLGAVGVTGLVEWPVVVAAGAGAFVLRTLAPGAKPKPQTSHDATVRRLPNRSASARGRSSRK